MEGAVDSGCGRHWFVSGHIGRLQSGCFLFSCSLQQYNNVYKNGIDAIRGRNSTAWIFIAPLFLPPPRPQHQNLDLSGQRLEKHRQAGAIFVLLLTNDALGTVKQVGRFQEQILEFPEGADKYISKSSFEFYLEQTKNKQCYISLTLAKSCKNWNILAIMSCEISCPEMPPLRLYPALPATLRTAGTRSWNLDCGWCQVFPNSSGEEWKSTTVVERKQWEVHETIITNWNKQTKKKRNIFNSAAN